MMDDDGDLSMTYFDEESSDTMLQKWKLDVSGALINRFYKEPVFVHMEEQVCQYCAYVNAV